MACWYLDGQGKSSWLEPSRAYNRLLTDVKGIVDALLAELGVTGYDINRGTEPYFHPGVSAQYVVDGNMIAQYGELHPQSEQKL